MSDDLNDDTVEALFSGQAQHEPLGQLLASIADRYASIPPPPPGPDLAAFMGDPPVDSGVVDRSIARRRHRRLVAAALTGTVLGKVVIGVSVAAASVAGMQASGIVHLPGLPGPHRDVLGSSAPATTATSTSTTTTEPTIDPEFTQRVGARDAGTVDVAVADDEFLWVRPVAAAGWTHTLEQQPTTALVRFQDGADAVIVDATIEGGFLHVVVLDQRDGSSDEYWFDGDGRPTDDPNPPAAPAPVPDAVTPPTPAPVDDDHDIDDDHDDEVEDRDLDEVDDRDHDERDEDDVDDREQRSSDDATSGALRDDDTRTDDLDDHDADDTDD